VTVFSLIRTLKELYRKQEEHFFSEREFLIALFQKNGIDPNLRILSPELKLSEKTSDRVIGDAHRVLNGYPLQYYLGTEFFCGEEFLVSPGVLIPRPETEVLVELGEREAAKESLVWDLCCGSGCVGISLLKRREDLSCHSFDLSPEAISLSEKNMKRLGVSDRLCLEKRDVLSEDILALLLKERPSLVMANPPYLTAEELSEIPANVAHEPKMALDGGEDGLLFYRAFARLALASGIPFLMEIGAGQEKSAAEIFKKMGMTCEVYRDFSSNPRVLLARGEND